MPEDTRFDAYFRRFGVRAASARLGLAFECFQMAPVEFYELGRARMRLPGEVPDPVLMEDILVDLAGKLLPDGGMPGSDEEQRWLASAVLALLFAEAREKRLGKWFRPHFKRLLAFLKKHPATQADPRRATLVARLEAKETFLGPWWDLAERLLAGESIAPEEFWQALPTL